MSGSEIRVLGPFEPTGQTLEQTSGPLGAASSDACIAGQESAAVRLAGWLPSPAVDVLGAYFENTAFHAPEALNGDAPPFVLENFLNRLCETPRAVHAAGAANAAQVELRTTDGPSDGTPFGVQPEPDSARVLFSPTSLGAALENGLSLGVRQFDRQFPEWAAMVDDIATVAEADIFTKLFVAGGNESVTEWHRDQSDVVVTMLTGAKRFEVAPVTARDEAEPDVEVSAELRPGSALVLPRSRAHCATPLGATSALLSIGVMRHGDWAFRSVAPTHLGLQTYPRSKAAYRLMLRPHVPAALWQADAVTDRAWRSRLPGGLVILDESSDGAELAALGVRFRSSARALRSLLSVVAKGVRTTEEIAADTDMDERECQVVLRELVTAELIAPC